MNTPSSHPESTNPGSTDSGLIENVYNLKLINMSDDPQTYSLSVSGLAGMKIIGPSDNIAIASGAVKDVPLRVQVDPIGLQTVSSRITFHIESETHPEIRLDETARFLGPVGR